MDVLWRLANCLEYPHAGLPESVAGAIASVSQVSQDAKTLLCSFQSYLEEATLSHLEEIYTRTFDLEAPCCLYAGYYLFGDTARRGIFMAQLKEEYKQSGFSQGRELPDHLTLMLRFLGSGCGREQAEELIALCILPAMEAMLSRLDDSDNPYHGLLRALWLVLDTMNHSEIRKRR